MAVILSYIQTQALLEARKNHQGMTEISPDLGMSNITVSLNSEGVSFAKGEFLDWASIERISRSKDHCYLIDERGMQPIQTFSETTNRVCSLLPTQGTPSLLISGFAMHRIKDIDPWQHAQRMLSALAPINGSVLDTTTGLGYTSILAARTAERVTTIELDAGAQHIAHLNPWSQELFTNPKITQRMGDAYDVVQTFGDESFDRIMHDPPTLKMAGELYSGTFYHELHRILKQRGRLFHYVGDPNSKAGNITHGVVRRLQESGFSRVVRHAEAYGVVAYK